MVDRFLIEALRAVPNMNAFVGWRQFRYDHRVREQILDRIVVNVTRLV